MDGLIKLTLIIFGAMHTMLYALAQFYPDVRKVYHPFYYVLKHRICLAIFTITIRDTSAKIEARKVLHIPEKIIGGVIDIVQNHNKNKPAQTTTIAQGQIQAQAGYIQGPQQYAQNLGSGYVNYGTYGTGGYQGSYPTGQYVSSGHYVQPSQTGQQSSQIQSQYQTYPQTQSGQFQTQTSAENQNQVSGQYQGVNQVQIQNQGFHGSNQLQSQVQGVNHQSQMQAQNTQASLQGTIQQTPALPGQFLQSNQQNSQLSSQNTQNVFTGTNSLNNQMIGQNQNVQFGSQNGQSGQLFGQNHQTQQFVGQNHQNGQYLGQHNQNTQVYVPNNPNSQFTQNQNYYGQSTQSFGQNTQPAGQVNHQYPNQNQQGMYQVGQTQGGQGGNYQMTTGPTGSNGPTCVCQAWTKPQLGDETAGRSEEITEKPDVS